MALEAEMQVQTSRWKVVDRNFQGGEKEQSQTTKVTLAELGFVTCKFQTVGLFDSIATLSPSVQLPSTSMRYHQPTLS
jgi:hypothetical protein